MSGPVQAAKTVANTVKDIVIAPPKAAIDTIKTLANGGSVGKAVGTFASENASPYLNIAKDIGKGVGLIKEPTPVPQTASDQPPSQEDLYRVKRQAQVDLQKDRPGRGGTILTDNYQYKV